MGTMMYDSNILDRTLRENGINGAQERGFFNSLLNHGRIHGLQLYFNSSLGNAYFRLMDGSSGRKSPKFQRDGNVDEMSDQLYAFLSASSAA